MPLYEYQCNACGHVFEKIKSFSDPEEKECPVCKGQVERLLSAPAVQFKGSGWYVTDYAGKNGSGKRSNTNTTDSSASAEKPAAAGSEKSTSSTAPSTKND
ncbi:FmdB family zinc ribbon protein [Pseudacidobacterium ailaaui]|uniref:FmdB family zinc ribbon protein n=1 Tax=Pseudacidobacterium ailaaui TaxID=1382359 RepID=UPI0005D16D8A|nr:zinc ribbon domain-containing protein [Pseudacidobacterium ailaaui]MBX6359956.1 zinc ribbon domain-containing protein [Pseudacidobacterium ailaaui]MCL6463323.1 zinc ribbon domain-containing protein [Pseudacidobacterium ailaaui]MDI3255257.1 zinc ribbon domain-containing protein [Bacillota bacterium]